MIYHIISVEATVSLSRVSTHAMNGGSRIRALHVTSSRTQKVTSATPAPFSSALAAGRLRCVYSMANEAISDWKKVLAVLHLGRENTLFAGAAAKTCALHSGFIFQASSDQYTLRGRCWQIQAVVYIKFSHLRANLKCATATLQHTNRCGGLFQASFHVSCSITYTADCWVLLPFLVSIVTISVPSESWLLPKNNPISVIIITFKWHSMVKTNHLCWQEFPLVHSWDISFQQQKKPS